MIRNMAAIGAFLAVGAAMPMPAMAAAAITIGENLTEGNASPFATANWLTSVYQQAYAAEAFGDAPIRITGMAFRVWPESRWQGFDPATFRSMTISLGIASRDVTQLGADMAANVAGSLTTVLAGPFSLSSPGTRDFDVLIPFADAFTYDPRAGDLLLQIDNPGGEAIARPFAAGWTSQMSRVLLQPNGVSTTIGYGLATRFFTGAAPAVPEPATWLMLATGFGVVGVAARRRRRVPAAA